MLYLSANGCFELSFFGSNFTSNGTEIFAIQRGCLPDNDDTCDGVLFEMLEMDLLSSKFTKYYNKTITFHQKVRKIKLTVKTWRTFCSGTGLFILAVEFYFKFYNQWYDFPGYFLNLNLIKSCSINFRTGNRMLLWRFLQLPWLRCRQRQQCGSWWYVENDRKKLHNRNF